MKKNYLIFAMMLLAALMLILSACGGGDKDDLTGLPDITPANYDWEITIIDGQDIERSDLYAIHCQWLGSPSAISDADNFSIKFDNQEYELVNFNLGGFRMIYGSATLNPGNSYDIKFYKNGSQLSAATLKTPYRAVGSYPATYNPQQSATMSWSLPQNNQFQAVVLTSDAPNGYQSDDFSDNIDASLRSFSFPAGAVDSYGPDTEYSMGIVQYSFKKSGRSAFMAIQTDGHYYEDNPVAKVWEKEDVLRLASKLIARHR